MCLDIITSDHSITTMEHPKHCGRPHCSKNRLQNSIGIVPFAVKPRTRNNANCLLSYKVFTK